MTRQFEFDVLTPIWLGGAARDRPYVKESGIAGSMRWWWEGLLRGAAKRVCAEHGKECDCGACELFGNTGHARRFRLRAEGLVPAKRTEWENIVEAPPRGWSAFTAPRRLTLHVDPRLSGHSSDLERVGLILKTISDLGGLGAKTQYGFGQVRLVTAVKTSDLGTLVNSCPSETKHPGRDRQMASPDPFTVSAAKFGSFDWTLPGGHEANPRGSIRDRIRRALRTDPTEYLGRIKVRAWNREKVDPRGSRIHITNAFPDGRASRIRVWFDRIGDAEIEACVDACKREEFEQWNCQTNLIP